MHEMKQQILQSVRETLKYHQGIGISGYRRDGIISQFLARECKTDPVAEASKKTLVLRNVSSLPEKKKNVEIPNVGVTTIADIHADVDGCTGCSLHQHRVFAAPGSSPDKTAVRLLIVGDWCRADQQGVSGSLLMGADEDMMLARMMKAIKLEEDKYFVTSVIKCALKKGQQPKAEHVTSCLSFLHRQIHVLKPEVILAMGMIGARALLKKSEPLSRLRGRFHPFTPGEGKAIPLMPTYHPNYLLQNPEMKQATWSDLQVLARHLGLLN